MVTPGGEPELALEGCDVLVIADSAVRGITGIPSGALVMVTDLDAGYEAMLRLPAYRAVLIHAHGDNKWLHGVAPALKQASHGNYVVTGQVEVAPGTPALAPFGFTDADRAFLLAAALEASAIELSWRPTPVLKPWSDPAVKALKMSLALRLIESYAQSLGYECTSSSPE